MERGERLGLIKKLGSRLTEESDTDLGLTLRAYEFPSPGFDLEYEAPYEYAVRQLEDGSDAQLAELHRNFFPDDPEFAAADSDEEGSWSAGTFRLFISHTNAYKGSAGRLSTQLGQWGVDGFVAHEAIEPTRKWQEEIEAALRTCDALVALLTPEFFESKWCDQEVGFAIARNVLIVPLKIGVDPHGFIGQYQAISIDPAPNSSSPYEVAHKVFDVLGRNQMTAARMAPAIVRRYASSSSVENTRDVFPLLEAISTSAWTPQMVEEVKRAGTANSQVRDAILPGGREVPAAVDELLAGMLGLFTPEAVPAGDDDIPF
jgi:hypothetical protein